MKTRSWLDYIHPYPQTPKEKADLTSAFKEMTNHIIRCQWMCDHEEEFYEKINTKRIELTNKIKSISEIINAFIELQNGIKNKDALSILSEELSIKMEASIRLLNALPCRKKGGQEDWKKKICYITARDFLLFYEKSTDEVNGFSRLVWHLLGHPRIKATSWNDVCKHAESSELYYYPSWRSNQANFYPPRAVPLFMKQYHEVTSLISPGRF